VNLNGLGTRWVGLRTRLGDKDRRKIFPLQGPELRPLGRPTRSQSYRLRYPDFPSFRLETVLVQLAQTFYPL
jgi:hypothetical protein